MRYKLLGQSGLRVSELCFGTMTFGQGSAGWGAPKEESRKVFDRFRDVGGNFLDTANSYQAGDSETFLGEFIAKSRHDYVISTKFTMGGRPNDPNSWGNHRKSLVQALEGSLRRLKTDYIDLYWMHAWDQLTPQEEVLRALDDLVRAGKILYIGLSDTPAWVVARSQAIAELRGWTSLAAVQIPYSLVERTSDRELLPMATALGLSIVTWGGLGGGLLSGKYQAGSAGGNVGRLSHTDHDRSHLWSDRNAAIVAGVERIASDLGATLSQVALAWVRTRSAAIIPILGARNVQQLEENLACLQLTLSDEHMTMLEQASAIQLGFPTDFLNSSMIRSVLYQNMRPSIDDPVRTAKV